MEKTTRWLLRRALREWAAGMGGGYCECRRQAEGVVVVVVVVVNTEAEAAEMVDGGGGVSPTPPCISTSLLARLKKHTAPFLP